MARLPPVLLDTQALVWFLGPKEQLGKRSLGLANAAAQAGQLYVSAVSFWEVARLIDRSRLRLSTGVQQWRETVLANGVREIAIDGKIAVRAHELMPDHPDPFDHFIVGAALSVPATLVTSDAELLSWKGPLPRQNARE